MPTQEPVQFALDENLVIVPLQKHCCLVLSVPAYLAGIRRGKWWRRRQAMLAREAHDVGAQSTISEQPISG